MTLQHVKQTLDFTLSRATDSLALATEIHTALQRLADPGTSEQLWRTKIRFTYAKI